MSISFFELPGSLKGDRLSHAGTAEPLRVAPPKAVAYLVELFEQTGVVLLGTLRKDGSPRISPVEPLFVEGELQLGMMWQSLKALDLLLDPRCTVHNCITYRMAKKGEFKLHAVASDIQDLDRRKRYCEELHNGSSNKY